jgi:hypothetical protein
MAAPAAAPKPEPAPPPAEVTVPPMSTASAVQTPAPAQDDWASQVPAPAEETLEASTAEVVAEEKEAPAAEALPPAPDLPKSEPPETVPHTVEEVAAATPAPAEERPSPKRVVTRETPQFVDAPPATERKETKPTTTDPQIGRVTQPAISVDDLIADVFDATQDLWMQSNLQPEDVAERMLDLALEKIPADAGTFYLADLNSPRLRFVAVRGPKADALRKMDAKVEVGQGIVGFCAQEGVCLAIHDMQHDARYFADIADKVGYQPENTLCAPAENEGRLFGAIQLINASAGSFDANQMELIRYIGITTGDILGRIDAAS